MLVHAITHNVKYLASIHSDHQKTLRETKKRLDIVETQNHELSQKNQQLETEVTELKKDADELKRKRDEINKMVVESQANAQEIQKLQALNDSNADQMEKLNLEVTVVITEKLTLKKELDRIDILYRQLKNQYKEQRVNYNLLVDEVTDLNTQNSKYRGLIMENEKKLGEIQTEI